MHMGIRKWRLSASSFWANEMSKKWCMVYTLSRQQASEENGNKEADPPVLV